MAVREQFKTIDYGDQMVGRILDAAEQCIERFGIRRTTVGEVARVGSLSRGSIYRYFDDKEALVDGVFQRQRQEVLNRTEAALNQMDSLVDKLTEAVVDGRRNAREGLFAKLRETEPETAAMMFMNLETYDRSLAFWPPHIEQAKQSGEIAAELADDVVTDFIMRLVVSLVMFPDMGVELKTRADVRRYLDQVVTEGLGHARPE